MTTRAEAKLRTQRALGDAALTLFAERGYAETTIEDIVEAAGVSRRTFFYHFPSKVAVAFPDEDAKVASVREILRQIPEDVDPIDAVRDISTRAFSERLIEIPHLRERYQLLTSSEELRTEDLRTDFLYEEVFSDFLIERSDGSPTSVLRARSIAATVIGVARATYYTWARAGDVFDPVEAFKELLDIHLPASVTI